MVHAAVEGSGSQQKDVYAAELVLTPGPRLTPEEAQDCVLRIADQDWWITTHPTVDSIEVLTPTIRDKSAAVAQFTPRTRSGAIGVRKSGVTEAVLIHELAHIGAHARYGTEGHDPAFCREYLELVFRIRGGEEWTKLRESFAKHGVRWD